MLEEWGVSKVNAHLRLSQGVLIFEIDITQRRILQYVYFGTIKCLNKCFLVMDQSKMPITNGGKKTFDGPHNCCPPHTVPGHI
jgi:hypothetical protein